MTQQNNANDTSTVSRSSRKLVIDLKPDVDHKPTFTEHSLEMKPVLEAITRYAQRTHAIGALRGARALELLAAKIDKITPTKESLEKLSQEIRAEAEELKSFIKSSA